MYKIIEWLRLQFANIAGKGFIDLLTSNYLIQIVSFASQLFVAWIMVPADIGRIKVMQTYLNLAIILGGMGFNSAILKTCSEAREEGEKKHLYISAYKYTLIVTVFVYLLLLLLSGFKLISTDNNTNKYMISYSLLLFPMTLVNLDIAYIQALKKIKQMARIQQVTKLMTVLLIVIATYFYKMEGYIISLLLGSLLTNALLWFYIKNADRTVETKIINNPFNEQWSYAKYSFLANGIGLLSMSADILLINYLINDKNQIGYYSFAATLILGLQTYTSTVQQIATPYFSEKSNRHSEWLRVFKKYNKIFVITSIFIGIAVNLAFPIIIKYLFKGKYDNSIIYFGLLSIGWFIRGLYSIKGIALFGLGKINMNFISALIALPFSFLVSYYFIANAGIVGAAYGNIAAQFFTFLIVSYQFKRVRGQIHPISTL